MDSNELSNEQKKKGLMSMSAAYKAARLTSVDGALVSDRAYNLIIGAVVLWGLALNYLMCRFFMLPILSLNYIAVLVIYFAGSLGGMFLVYKSPNPALSFIGFNIMAVGMGVLLTYYVSLFDPMTVISAVRVTAAVTCVMLILAVIRPTFFLRLGRTLIVALIACIVFELVSAFVFRRGTQWLDWVVALIFCGYIGYDWARAQQYPRTLDNAVDSAADIYVDIVNLFIRILSILGRRD